MTINVIDKNMINTTSIIVEPEINFITADSKCNFLERHNISEPGTFGSIKSSNINIKKNRIFNVSDRFVKGLKDQNINVIEKITNVKELESCLRALIRQNTDDSLDNYNNNIVEKNKILDLAINKALMNFYRQTGIQFNTSNANVAYEFGAERIKQEYLLDGESSKKKQAIKNLYQYYRENIQHNNFYDLNWGFKNFNALNFFTIDNAVNINFSQDKTHKNCIFYPNLANNQKQTYDLTKNKDFTVSFYVNPRRKNKQDYHYNPGCIIDIPGVLSVYIVSGNKLDENGLKTSFRLVTQFGEETFQSLSNSTSQFNFSSNTAQNNGLNYLSQDELLSFNSWHNICLTYKRVETQQTSGYNFEFFIDGVLIDQKYHSVSLSTQNFNSYISIGNKLEVSKNNIEDFVLKAFSKDKESANDNDGPYAVKHISYSNQIDTVLSGFSNTNNTYQFKNSLNRDNSDYITESVSLALNAELYDVRIYEQSFSSEDVINIKDNGVKNLKNETDNSGLIFYLPAFYKSQNVSRKGLVNLSAPYKKYYALSNSNETVDENLTGDYGVSALNQSTFIVDTAHISYNFPINPFFLNYTGGTEVSVESFLQEFVQKVQPNVVFGGNISEDVFQNSFLAKTSFILNDKFFNKQIKEGCTPNDLIDTILLNLSADDLQNLSHIDYQFDNILYKNYLILPNDNGIQKQFYSNDIFQYDENDDLKPHINDLNELDYSFVSMRYVNEEFFEKSNVSHDLLLTGEYLFDDELVEDSNRRPYYIENDGILAYITQQEKGFKENYDKLKNISLNNYHSDNHISFLNAQDADTAGKWRNTGSISGSIDMYSQNSFYKTYSNPATRSFYSDFRSSIKDNEIYHYKSLGQQNNIAYKKMYLPLRQLDKNSTENSSTIICLSNQLFNKKLKRETILLKDVDLASSAGLSITFKDSKLGTLYRADSVTGHAKWNSSGNVIYREGIAALHHPSLYNFGKTNFSFNSKTYAQINTFELNVPAHKNETNLSSNASYIENLRLNESAFNSDEDFVYITDIDFHDENLNIIAKAKLAQPFAKKNSDNVLFRVKMDY